MSVTIACALQQAKEALAGGESPATDAKVLLAHVLGQTQTWLYTWSDKVLKDEELNRFRQLISERKTGRPVAHLTGNRDFWTLTLNVNPATLIPRPETELLVEKALELLPSEPCNVCDLGTGTGAVALALASERPDIQVTGTDRIEEAVDLAKQNAALNHITNVSFIVSHWFDALKDKQFDMLVTNPPYVESESHYLQQGDVRFEPLSALTAGEDGLDDIRLIISQASVCLKPGGWLLIEHGSEQGSAIRGLFNDSGYIMANTFADLAGLDRITIAKRPACE